MAQLVMCLFCRRKDLSLVLRTHAKGLWCTLGLTVLGKQKQLDPEVRQPLARLAYQARSKPVRGPVSRKSSDTGGRPLSSDFHMHVHINTHTYTLTRVRTHTSLKSSNNRQMSEINYKWSLALCFYPNPLANLINNLLYVFQGFTNTNISFMHIYRKREIHVGRCCGSACKGTFG